MLVVQEITEQGGKALLWTGTNLQYPEWVKEIQFRVVAGATPSIEWEYDIEGKSTITAVYDPAKDLLRGWLKSSAYNNEPWGPIDLYHNQSFYVYKDYARYSPEKEYIRNITKTGHYRLFLVKDIFCIFPKDMKKIIKNHGR